MANLLEIIAIILSIVALIVTVIGFFASLKFYRDGVKLQENANNALTRIEEKASSIQTQVGGMFDKTLEAALRSSTLMQQDFEAINMSLKEATIKIEGALEQIENAGEGERKRIKQIVDKQIKEVRTVVDSTQENWEKYVEQTPTGSLLHLLSIEPKVIAYLKAENDWVSISELSRYLGIRPIAIQVMLSSLKQEGKIKSKKMKGEEYFRLHQNPFGQKTTLLADDQH